MPEYVAVSVIVPFYNAEPYVKRCIDSLLKQDFDRLFEVIMVDDGSTDNSLDIVKNQNLPLLKLRSLPSNAGPSAARNIGLTIAKGEYVFFLDADDAIPACALKTLYNHVKGGDFDLVFSDTQRIEESQDQSENLFCHPTDKIYSNSDITEEIKKRIYDPLFLEGLVGIKGRLIKRSILTRNSLTFEERLRYLEDEIFAWDVLAHCKKAKYIRKQLYSYYINPKIKSGVSVGFDRGFVVSNFKLAKARIKNCFEKRGLSTQETEDLANHAFISFVIGALVSYSRSIILGKVDLVVGKKTRKSLIEALLKDPDISKAIIKYSPSKNESLLIPRAIAWKCHKLLEFACNNRAKEILRIRRKVTSSPRLA